jgi:hypothetical protein
MRLKIAKRRWEIEANTGQMPGQERRETNYKPFFQVERLKQNLVRQLERFAKRSEDFNLGSNTVHEAYSETVRPARSSALCSLVASYASARIFDDPMLYSTREIRQVQRRYPIGAELIGPDEVHFRVWAPKAQRVDLVLKTAQRKTQGKHSTRWKLKKEATFPGPPMPTRALVIGSA